MTQPIQPDRPTSPISDRDRPTAPRAPASSTPDSAQTATGAGTTDTADVSHGSALLRSAAAGPGTVSDSAQARELAARITEALHGDPARAMRAYAATRHEDVQALLATV